MASVNELRFVGYGVPDVEAECEFYREKWGLIEVGEEAGVHYFAAEGSDEPYVVRLRHAPEQRIEMIGFAAESRADVEALHAQVVNAGCKVLAAPAMRNGPGGGFGFRFFSPDGLPFEISSDVDRRAHRELDRWEDVPQKISHIVLHSPDHKAAAQFFIDVLGFRLSDWLGDLLAFLRCNEWHHRIGILPGPACLNHVAYDMSGVDAMMRGIGRLKSQDVELVWGPGRHTAGNNTFGYFITPGGIAVEYTADLEKIDEANWVAKVHKPGPRTVDQWGIGVGGPQTMPHPHQDPGLFEAMEV